MSATNAVEHDIDFVLFAVIIFNVLVSHRSMAERINLIVLGTLLQAQATNVENRI